MNSIAFIGGGAASGVVLHFLLMSILSSVSTIMALAAIACFFNKQRKRAAILALPGLLLCGYLTYNKWTSIQFQEAQKTTVEIIISNEGSLSIWQNNEPSDKTLIGGVIDFTLTLPDGITVSDSIKGIDIRSLDKRNQLLLRLDSPSKSPENWRDVFTAGGNFTTEGEYFEGGFDDTIIREGYTVKAISDYGGYIRVNFTIDQPPTETPPLPTHTD